MKNKKLNTYLIHKNENIKNALIRIRKSGSRTLVVIDNSRKLLGTISQGDISKALIKNRKLSSEINNIYNKNPVKIYTKNINKEKIKKLFIDGQYGIIPVVNSSNIIQKILTWKEIFNPHKEQINLKNIDVVIMAGGKGTRLRPYTEVLPKPLIPINAKPMLEHIIENFTYFNFNKFHLVLNYQAEIIKSYFNSINKDYNLNYTKEPKPLGTAGGISFIKKISSEDFLIANCDTLFKIDYIKFFNYHKKNNNFITLGVSKTQHVFPYGSCRIVSEKLISLQEKPKFNIIANTGIYFVKKEIISLIPKNKKLDMNELVEKCLKLKKRAGAYMIPSSSWKDLGQLSDFEKARKDI